MTNAKNIALTGRDNQLLASLRSDIEAVSDTEVIRYALRYLESFYNDTIEGRTLLIQPPSGEPQILQMTSLSEMFLRSSGQTTKHHIRLQGADLNRLDKLHHDLGISATEVVRRAIRYLGIILNETKKGSAFALAFGDRLTQMRMDVLTSKAAVPRHQVTLDNSFTMYKPDYSDLLAAREL